MGDSLVIIAPLLVLAVVLLLGFAGCSFELPEAERILTFVAKVPADLTVIAPGVIFTWTRPGQSIPETATVPPLTSPSSVDSYITATLNLGPSLLWTLGAVNGLTDRSPNGHDGTALGGVTVGGDLDGPTAFPDATATRFDGNNDGIGSSYNPYVGTTARTFVGWARWDSGGVAEYTLFGSSAGDNNRPNLRVVVANRDLKWLPSGDDGQVITWSAAAAPEDTWFMWALRADPANDQATLFIDGAKISDESMIDEWPGNPGTFQAALGATNSHPFRGAQGLVAVFEKALTDADVAALYETSQGFSTYEFPIPSPEAGSWRGRCEMRVRLDSQTPRDSSPDLIFDLPAVGPPFHLLFRADAGPPFEVKPDGKSQG